MSVFWHPKGCVLWFDFGTLRGNKVYDLSKQGNHGTIHGAIWKRGHLTGSLFYDGVDDYTEIPHSPSLAISDAITYELFVKILDFPIDKPTIFGKYTSPRHNWYIWIDNTVSPHLWHLGFFGTYYREVTVSRTTVNRWAYIVFTYDRAYMKAYFNGEKLAEAPQTEAITSGTGSMWVACKYSGVSHANILISLLRIYSRALTEEEIKAHYHYLTKPIARAPI